MHGYMIFRSGSYLWVRGCMTGWTNSREIAFVIRDRTTAQEMAAKAGGMVVPA